MVNKLTVTQKLDRVSKRKEELRKELLIIKMLFKRVKKADTETSYTLSMDKLFDHLEDITKSNRYDKSGILKRGWL